MRIACAGFVILYLTPMAVFLFKSEITMKINFTKEEFVTLLEMIDIANWVISANKVEKGPTEKPYKELEEKPFALSPEFGCEDKVKYSKELDGYYPTYFFEMESPHRNFIDEYNEETFWDELIDRLARRNVIRELGEKEFLNLEPIERFKVLGMHEEKWAKEFAYVVIIEQHRCCVK